MIRTDSADGRHSRMMPEDVRLPLTAGESDAALDMIDRIIERLETTISRTEYTQGVEWPSMRRLLANWEKKRAEVAYAAERLDAGEPPLSIELAVLRAKVDALTAENIELKSRTGSAQAFVSSIKGSRRERLAENESLKKQNEDLVEKNRRLSEAMKALESKPKSPQDEERKDLRRSLHETMAFTAEVLDDASANGGSLTPIARLLLQKCIDSLPRGYRIKWRALNMEALRTAADVMAAEALSDGAP